MKYIVNGKIVLPDAIVEGSALAFDEKIIGLASADQIPQGAELIDAKAVSSILGHASATMTRDIYTSAGGCRDHRRD